LKIKLAFRLSRVLLHVIKGFATCALLFPWLDEARRNGHIQRWSRQLLGICGITVELAGSSAPAAHALLVANHVSWLDIFLINALCPSRFVAKSEIRAWPVLGRLAVMAGTVFIVRGRPRDLRHIFQGLVASLRQGQRVAFFPEGTTAAQGTLLPFHANLFEAAIDAGAPVQPYALRYLDAQGALHPGANYIGDTSFAESMVTILSGPPMHAQLVCLAPIEARGAHRRELAGAAHAAIGAALQRRA